MATSTMFLCLSFILVTTLFSSLQLSDARDSQFFSKVSRNPDTGNNPNNYYQNRETQNSYMTPLTKNQQQDDQQQPAFVPQTTDADYGLFGHETGLDAPSTTTTTNAALYNMDDNKYENQNKLNNQNEKMSGEKNYTPELKGVNEFSYQSEVGPSKYVAENNYNNEGERKYVADAENRYNNGEGKFVAENNFNNNGEGNYVAENRYNNNGEEYVAENNYNNNGEGKYVAGNNYNNKNGEYKYVVAENNYKNSNNGEGKYYTGARYNNGGVVEKQGMSDTRYLENGKYFYDINAEKKFDPNRNYNMYHTYYYNNDDHNNDNYEFYGNRENSHEEYFNNKNYKRFQNQFPEEDEFDFDEQP